MEEKKINIEMEKFIGLVQLHQAGFIDDAELKIAVQEKKISEKILIQAIAQDKIVHLYECAAIVLSDMDGAEDITSALISAALPGEIEAQKRIAKMAKGRKDYAEKKKRLVEAI